MQQVGVIGYPIAHSLSPAMQQAAIDWYGLDARYEAWEVPPGRFGEAARALRARGVWGANVTIPYKEEALRLADEVAPSAAAIGAVNTLVNHFGRLAGYNTDAPGFLRALREDAGFAPAGAQAVLLGAGGAARAVALALLEAGVDRLLVLNRDPRRAAALADWLSARARLGRVAVKAWTPDTARQGLAEADLAVNATPVGMRFGPAEDQSPVDPTWLRPGCLVFDLVYTPRETPLLRGARALGLPALGGLPMLVYQGAEAFELWTSLTAPVEQMRAAAESALESRGHVLSGR